MGVASAYAQPGDSVDTALEDGTAGIRGIITGIDLTWFGRSVGFYTSLTTAVAGIDTAPVQAVVGVTGVFLLGDADRGTLFAAVAVARPALSPVAALAALFSTIVQITS